MFKIKSKIMSLLIMLFAWVILSNILMVQRATAIDIPTVTSTTHPSSASFYNNKQPAMNWISTLATGYSYTIDQSPLTDPTTPPESITSKTFGPLADGTWYFHTKAIDESSNWSSISHYQIKIDTTSPAFKWPLIAKKYYKGTVDLSYTINNDLSGLSEAKLYHKSKQLSVSKNSSKLFIWNSAKSSGAQFFSLQATDKAGNKRSVTKKIFIDNIKPKTEANKYVTIKQGAAATLKFKVIDPQAGGKAKITIKITKYDKQTIKSIKLGLRKIGMQDTYSFRPNFAKGAYKFNIYAEDRAGNKQHNIAKNYLILY